MGKMEPLTKNMKSLLKPKSYLLILVMFFSLADSLFGMGATPQIQIEKWKQVPLRSHAQKEAGLMGGEGMQRVYKIAYAPSNPQIVYLISNTSQTWKSEDGGNLWKMMHKGFLSNGGIDISVDPLNENIVFAAGSLCKVKSPFYSSPVDGIYRTLDGGKNWRLVKQTSFFGESIEGKHFAFNHERAENSKTKTVYAGTHKDGLLISTDGGNNWKTIGFKGERILDIKRNPSDPTALYLLTVKGLFKVVIKNSTILRIKRLGEDLPDKFKTFALNPEDPSIIYAAMGKGGVYKSSDGGITFFRLKKGLPLNLNYTQIALSRVNPEQLYVSVHKSARLNPFWSNDGGESWHSPVTLNKDGLSLTEGRYASASIATHPGKPDIALTSTNGVARIIKTIDGGTNWFYSGNGYTGGRKSEGTTSHAFYPDPEKMIFFLMDFGPALTVDGGKTFRLIDIPRVNGAKTTSVGSVSPTDGNLIVTAIGRWEKQKLAVSRDNGRIWRIFRETDDRYKFIAFHPQKPNIIYASGFISKDNGKTWRKLTQKVYGIFRSNGDIVYSIDEFGKNKSVIKRSDNRGKTWISPYPYIPVKASSINEIDIDPLNPNRIYIASNSGLYILNNKKRMWLNKDKWSGLSKDYFGFPSIKCVAVDPTNPNVVYAGKWAPGKGQSNGIFRSIDYGNTWGNITYNLVSPFSVWSISVSPHDGTVYIGSSHGTWKLPPPY